ncbi:hypothetical protein GCM10009726_33000 [Nocardioides furvisabuli]|uniref:Uncharacterized protein n=2 Tax=Nocardioides furvisabuli TaxID=375542 RepID=A0ABP5JA76_9ACTN
MDIHRLMEAAELDTLEDVPAHTRPEGDATVDSSAAEMIGNDEHRAIRPPTGPGHHRRPIDLWTSCTERRMWTVRGLKSGEQRGF